MNATWLVALAALGVQYSYRTGLDRQPEYVLQIEPEVLPALAAGEQIYSEIPSDVGPFARLCLVILPADGTPAKHTTSAEDQFRQLLVSAARYAARDRGTLASDLPPAILWPGRGAATPEAHYGVSTGWQPDDRGQQQFLVQLDPVLVGTLSSGDELYVPIDRAAGRLARFIVKVGKENLPRISQPPQVTAESGRQAPADLQAGRNSSPVAGVGGTWPLNSGTSDGSVPSRFGNPPRENASREMSHSPTGWPTVGGGARFPANEPAAGRLAEQPAAAVGPISGDVAARGYAPSAGTPVGPAVAETWALPPAASVGLPSGYGPAMPPPAGELAPRGYGPSGGDPRGALYPDMRTATLPSGATPAGSAPLGTVPPAAGMPTGQVLAGPANVAPANPGAGLPAGGSPVAAGGTSATAQGTAAETDRPWGLLLLVTFALFFSIGGNLYLAYTALEYHNRYRSALERLRAAARGN